jgi:hypothetical protein
MKNSEIPDRLWDKRNEIVDNIEKHMSNANSHHVDYKGGIILGALRIRNLCEEILNMAEKYQPPKEPKEKINP